MKNKLPVTEELDFHYLLELMAPLKDIDEYQWLPEFFSIIGYESLILLCKYAGGEIIRIPTIEELTESIETLQIFYDVYIKHSVKESEIPDIYKNAVKKILEIYNAGNSA